MTKVELILLIKDKAREAGDQKTLAAEWNVSEAYLSDVINGRKEPGEKILTPLGVKQVVTYEFNQ